ncbi:MAG: DNA-directed RNA polymerase subunit beta [Defluviitaleaceae bacterium]|nr:DNA-directed RNA polymerase subunit beta [Defluviitaleaceae bacterium]
MVKGRIRKTKSGACERVSFSAIPEVLDMPSLIEVQKNSYKWFLNEGLREVLTDTASITNYSGSLELSFTDYSLDETAVKYSVSECKERDATYSAPLRVKARLRNKDADEIKEQDIYMGEFPLMTDTGTFIINGAERVIVSQLIRSPGIYYETAYDKVGKQLHTATLIPNRGEWIEYETDSNDVFYVRVARTRKIPATILLRSFGIGTDNEIINLFGEEPKILATIEKDVSKSKEEGLIEIYKKIRPGEPPTVESSESLLRNMFFDPRRYDLAKVGRYKYNKKLALRGRIVGLVLAESVADADGEIIAEAGCTITREIADAIQNTGTKYAAVYAEGDQVHRVLTNQFVNIRSFVASRGIDADKAFEGTPLVKELVHYPTLRILLDNDAFSNKDDLIEAISDHIPKLVPKNVTLEDIVASMSYIIGLDYGIGHTDDIDHLGNRRIRAVGELLQTQFRIGMTRMERVIRERMTIQDMEAATPQMLVNIRPVTAAIKEFFGSSQLSQFMQQTNPLEELTHKRRLSALGPGGLSRDRASMEVRDVHSSHYGRMCPIETPEGPNIGLINSLATFARINEYGFIESPYRRVVHDGGVSRVTDEIIYLTADEEETHLVAQANARLGVNNELLDEKIIGRSREDFVEIEREKLDLMDVSPKQIVSVATSLIPFLENDDVSRALMGSNMQRQAVPLLIPTAPVVGTGTEFKAGSDSGVIILAGEGGIVERVSADRIVVKNDKNERDHYKLTKFKRSNQGTCINQRPVVNEGERIVKGQVLADGPSTQMGELALGKNPLIAFMSWEGYNYEDAILISENLVIEDAYTSVHIEEYEAESRETKLGPEEITRDIPNVSPESLKDLDERGIIRIGAEVRPNDILVGKVTPKGETELTSEERLLRAIFGEKAREVRDTSLKVPHGESGTIVDVRLFTREAGDELPPGVNMAVRVYIAQKRKISVGDKMAGRHGNKGVISRIIPAEDMPFLPNGRPVDIVLNPLGVPSRMNIGQVMEVHMGLAAKVLNWKIATPVFDGANEFDIMDTLNLANDYANMSKDEFESRWKDILEPDILDTLITDFDAKSEWKGMNIPRDGKIHLRDGRSGEFFDQPATVGFMHYLKLHHLVDDKIHARSTGPYSLVTQQPLGGKAQFGGQRFGEMEVWALEAYGASYTLQEILTVKSDDIVGRVKTYEAIVKGENVPAPGVPESFNVLLKELQALALDVRVLDEDNEVIIRERIDDGDDLKLNLTGYENDFDEDDRYGSPKPQPRPIDFDADDDDDDDFEYEDTDEDEDDDIDETPSVKPTRIINGMDEEPEDFESLDAVLAAEELAAGEDVDMDID